LSKVKKKKTKETVSDEWRHYANQLSIPEGKSGDLAIKYKRKPAGWQAALVTGRTALFGQHKSGAVTFPEATVWHDLLEKGSRWTTDYPIEQFQQRKQTEGFTDSVLVGGLGVGFIASDLARREEIYQVTVVERSQDVINLVWPHLLRGEPGLRDKLEIVNADLFSYLEKEETQSNEYFDFGFFDIWRGDSEDTFFNTVVPLRQHSEGVIGELTCWNEEVMRGQLISGLQSRMMVVTMSMIGPHKKPFSIDDLCNVQEKPHAIFMNWSAYFFRWARQHNVKLEDTIFSDAVAWYASLVFKFSGWRGMWDRKMMELGFEVDPKNKKGLFDSSDFLPEEREVRSDT
jgi:hypothetical protein